MKKPFYRLEIFIHQRWEFIGDFPHTAIGYEAAHAVMDWYDRRGWTEAILALID